MVIFKLASTLLGVLESRNTFDFGNLERGYINNSGFQGLYFLTASPIPVDISENTLYFYFGDLFVKRIGDALDGHEWPDGVMPVSERRKVLSEIEVQISKLDQRRKELVELIDNAGIVR